MTAASGAGETPRLGFATKLAYAVGATATYLKLRALSTFLVIFYNQVVGLPPAMVYQRRYHGVGSTPRYTMLPASAPSKAVLRTSFQYLGGANPPAAGQQTLRRARPARPARDRWQS